MKKHIFLGALLCLYASMPAWTQNKAFIQNVGQITDPQLQARTDIDFKVSEQKGLQVYVGKGQLHYQWIEPEHTSDSTTLYHSYRLDMQLVGSNMNPRLSYGQQQQAYERYFLSWVNTDNSNDGKVAHRYNSVTYHNVYPHIDWKLYFTADGKMEYDFIVHPGGKVSDIQLVYQGADSLNIDQHGRLNIYTPKGQLVESAPYSYEQKSKRPIASNFQLLGNKVSFNSAAHKGTLVIDPIIEWGSYLGGSLTDGMTNVIEDAWGNIYTIGTTKSSNNIATTGSHQQTFGGSANNSTDDDAIMTKWTKEGLIIWSTYYGGNKVDQLKNIAINANHQIFVVGYTASPDGIATANSFQDTLYTSVGTNYDLFIVSFDTNGVRNWGTYFGGNSQDGNAGSAIVIDELDNLYITGSTTSSNLWLSVNPYKSTNTLTDAIVLKMNATGTPIWSTYFGGNGTDVPTGLQIDNYGNLYMIGHTNSTTELSYNSVYKNNLTGTLDGFITKLDTSGSFIWCTYTGGSETDRLNSITVLDTQIIVGGQSTSMDNIATMTAFQATLNSGLSSTSFDGFLESFNSNGEKLWGSYWGGQNLESVLSLTHFDDQNIYVLIQALSPTNIATSNGLFTTISGTSDLALAKINKHGERIWSTYIGGNLMENNGNIGVSKNKEIYITGRTNSSNQIATVGTHQTALAGDYDGFLIKINDCDAPIITTNIMGPDTLCPHTTALYSIASIPDASNYHWLLPTGWHGQSDSNSIAVMVHGQSGTVSVYTQSDCGGISDTVHMEVHVYPNRTISIQRQNNILRTTQVFPSYQWLMNGSPIAGANNSTYIPTSNGIYSLQVIDENGCMFVSDTIDLTHLSIVDPTNKLLAIYPNPTEGKLALDLPTAGTIQVIDLLGRNCLQVQVTAGKQQLDLSKLPAGTYTLLYTTAEGQYSGLVVKE